MNIHQLNVKNSSEINIVLTGVGGQGILLASDIIAEVAMEANFDVKKSEVHGMAQRGGSVVSQVRYGQKIYSPLISEGRADIILAFEKLEAVRYLDYIKQHGIVIYNNQQITPLTVFSMNLEYPQNIEQLCLAKTKNVIPIDVLKITESLKNLKVLNSVMLGVLSNFLEFEKELWLKIISKRVPKKTIDLNSEAFKMGNTLLIKESE